MFKFPTMPPPHHIGKPDGCFPPEKPHYTVTENVEFATREMRETISRLLAFEERMKNDFDGMLRHITQDNVTFKDTFYSGYQTFTKAIETEINEFESNIDNSIKLFVDNLNAEFEELTSSTANSLAESKEAFASFIADVNTRYDDFVTSYTTAFAELQSAINSRYDSHERAVNTRLEGYYSTYTTAFADYQQKLTTDLNTFEATVNNNFNVFSSGVTDSLNLFKQTWEEIITTRLNAQDGKIADAELYMKTNLNATVRTELGDMVLTGEFDEFFDDEFMEEAAEHHQMKVEFVEDESAFVNSRTLYVLPDGYIYQYRASENEEGETTYAWENTGKTFAEIVGAEFGDPVLSIVFEWSANRNCNQEKSVVEACIVNNKPYQAVLANCDNGSGTTPTEYISLYLQSAMVGNLDDGTMRIRFVDHDGYYAAGWDNNGLYIGENNG